MMRGLNFPAGAIAVLSLSLAAAQSAGAQPADAAQGATLFATHCSECHSVREGKDKKGPSLFNLVGAHAGARDGFAYSEALRASGLIWSAENLSGYLSAPKKFLPGGKMKYDGLASAAERADLIAFLAAQGRR